MNNFAALPVMQVSLRAPAPDPIWNANMFDTPYWAILEPNLFIYPVLALIVPIPNEFHINDSISAYYVCSNVLYECNGVSSFVMCSFCENIKDHCSDP